MTFKTFSGRTLFKGQEDKRLFFTEQNVDGRLYDERQGQREQIGSSSSMSSEDNHHNPGSSSAAPEQLNAKNTVISSFVSVIEGTKDLSLLSEEKHLHSPKGNNHDTNGKPRKMSVDRYKSSSQLQAQIEGRRRTSDAGVRPGESRMVNVQEGNIPLPAKCSNQLKKLIYAHSVTSPPTNYYKRVETNNTADGVVINITDDQKEDGSPEKRPIFPHLPYSPYCSPNSSPRVRRKPLRETNRVNSINDQSGEYVQLNQYKLEGAIGQVQEENPAFLGCKKHYVYLLGILWDCKVGLQQRG